jgi:hypothetical protein
MPAWCARRLCPPRRVHTPTARTGAPPEPAASRWERAGRACGRPQRARASVFEDGSEGRRTRVWCIAGRRMGAALCRRARGCSGAPAFPTWPACVCASPVAWSLAACVARALVFGWFDGAPRAPWRRDLAPRPMTAARAPGARCARAGCNSLPRPFVPPLGGRAPTCTPCPYPGEPDSGVLRRGRRRRLAAGPRCGLRPRARTSSALALSSARTCTPQRGRGRLLPPRPPACLLLSVRRSSRRARALQSAPLYLCRAHRLYKTTQRVGEPPAQEGAAGRLPCPRGAPCAAAGRVAGPEQAGELWGGETLHTLS